MNITICDQCKEKPNAALIPTTIYHFELGQTWTGKPQQVKELCSNCLDKIFNTRQSN